MLRRVRSVVVDAINYQDLPFEKLVEELQPERRRESHTAVSSHAQRFPASMTRRYMFQG